MLLTYGLSILVVAYGELDPRGQNNPAGQSLPVVIDPSVQYLPTGHAAHSLELFKFVLSL